MKSIVVFEKRIRYRPVKLAQAGFATVACDFIRSADERIADARAQSASCLTDRTLVSDACTRRGRRSFQVGRGALSALFSLPTQPVANQRDKTLQIVEVRQIPVHLVPINQQILMDQDVAKTGNRRQVCRKFGR